MSATTTAKPYEVGERVRVRSDEGLPWHEGPVISIDGQGYLFIKTAPWIQSDGSEVDVDFVVLNADRTAPLYRYEIQRVGEEGPVPSLVQLDREEAWLAHARRVGISEEFAQVPNGTDRLAFMAGWDAAFGYRAVAS